MRGKSLFWMAAAFSLNLSRLAAAPACEPSPLAPIFQNAQSQQAIALQWTPLDQPITLQDLIQVALENGKPRSSAKMLDKLHADDPSNPDDGLEVFVSNGAKTQQAIAKGTLSSNAATNAFAAANALALEPLSQAEADQLLEEHAEALHDAKGPAILYSEYLNNPENKEAFESAGMYLPPGSSVNGVKNEKPTLLLKSFAGRATILHEYMHALIHKRRAQMTYSKDPQASAIEMKIDQYGEELDVHGTMMDRQNYFQFSANEKALQKNGYIANLAKMKEQVDAYGRLASSASASPAIKARYASYQAKLAQAIALAR